MRVIATLLFAAAGAMAATSSDIGSLVAQFPTCSFTCLDPASKSVSCTLTDYKCLCSNIVAIQNAAANCLTTSCSVDDLTKLSSLSTQLCQAINGGTASAAAPSATGPGAANNTGSGGAQNTSGGAGAGASSSPLPASAGRTSAAVGAAGFAVAAAVALIA